MESSDKPQTSSRKVKADVLKDENNELQHKLQEQQEEAKRKDLELQKLKAALVQKDGQLNVYKYQTPDFSPKEERVFLPKPIFYGMVAILVGLAALAAYSFLFKKEEKRLGGIITYADSSSQSEILDSTDEANLLEIKPSNASNTKPEAVNDVDKENKNESNLINLKKSNENNESNKSLNKATDTKNTAREDERITVKRSNKQPVATKKPVVDELNKPTDAAQETKSKSVVEDEDPNYVELPPQGKYYINVQKAYLYDQPDLKTKGYFYMVPSNNSVLYSLDEKNGFIFVEFTSSQGLNLRGWIKTNDLVKIN